MNWVIQIVLNFVNIVLDFLLTFKTSYLTDSYIVFTLKMESVSKNTIFGQKMMVKSGLEQFILKSLMKEDSYFYYWICDFGHFYEVRKSSLPRSKLKRYCLESQIK